MVSHEAHILGFWVRFPAPQLDLLLMNRELRRELTKNKWISRVRKIYRSWGTFKVPIKGIKHSTPFTTMKTYRNCESITDFLNDSKFAKKLKHSTVIGRSKMHQLDAKRENRKERYNAKKQIQEEIQETL